MRHNKVTKLVLDAALFVALAATSAFTAFSAKAGTVAKIDSAEYATLAAAIAAAEPGQTVKLASDTDENVTIAKNLTLDLNGHTLNGGAKPATATLKVTANVTVKDSSTEQKGTIKRTDTAENSSVTSYSAYYVIDIQGENAALTFESGNVVNDSGTTTGVRQGASLVRVGSDKYPAAKPTLTIKGGTFKQDNFPVIKVDYGTFYLEDGTITCASDEAVKNWADAFIKGGVINGTIASWVCGDSICSSTLEISGGTINGNVYSMTYDGVVGEKTATVDITGGTVTGNLGTYQGTSIRDSLTTPDDESNITIAVSGGTFSSAVDAKYCASGYQPEKIRYCRKVGDGSAT